MTSLVLVAAAACGSNPRVLEAPVPVATPASDIVDVGSDDPQVGGSSSVQPAAEPNRPTVAVASPRSNAPMAALRELWRRWVGFMNFRATIHVRGGEVFVGTNGRNRETPTDRSDGVYVLSARDGAVVRHFSPPGGGDYDTNGLAIDDRGLYFGTDQHRIYATELDGRVRWSRDLVGDVEGAPVLADMNGDGVHDVAVGAEDADFYVLNGTDGSVLHRISTSSGSYDQKGFLATAAAADVTGDGIPEIFAASRDERFLAINGATGQILWQNRGQSGRHSAPILVNADDDPALEVIFTESYSSVVCADAATGTVEWKHELEHPGMGIEGLFGALGWLPARRCALIGTAWWQEQEGMYCVSRAGVEWRYTESRGNITSGAVIGDVDGHPGDEIVFGTESGKLVVLADDGEPLLQMHVGGAVECTPTLADLDGDGLLEILVAIADGNLIAYKTGGSAPATIGYYRGQSTNDGRLLP